MKTNKKTIVLSALVALLVFGVALPVVGSYTANATDGESTSQSADDTTSDGPEDSSDGTEPDDSSKTEIKGDAQSERQNVREQEIKDRKDAVKKKLDSLRQDRKEKLSSLRLQVCEKRQTRINTIFSSGTSLANKHLAIFQKIQQKVEDFYKKNNLSADGYDAAVAAADQKEAAAAAVLQSTSTVSFNCESTDGAHPGSVIKQAVQMRHTALKEYRTAIKNLILIVKKANGQSKTTEGSN